jgi:hypothetical protein
MADEKTVDQNGKASSVSADVPAKPPGLSVAEAAQKTFLAWLKEQIQEEEKFADQHLGRAEAARDLALELAVARPTVALALKSYAAAFEAGDK